MHKDLSIEVISTCMRRVKPHETSEMAREDNVIFSLLLYQSHPHLEMCYLFLDGVT